MNFDYIAVTKRQSKNNICFDYLEQEGSFVSGWEKYSMKAKNKMVVWINENSNELKLKTNFGYFLNGHNFLVTKKDLISGFQQTSELLNINLFDADVMAFEFGTVANIQQQPQEFLSNHISINKNPLQPFFKKKKLTGKGFEDSSKRIKLYDVGYRIKTNLPEEIRRDLRSFCGYDKAKHYIKLENHYKKPEAYFKKRIFVNDLLEDGFMKLCKEDLITTYKSIMKTGIIQLPKKKADINSATLPLIVLKELAVLFDFNAEELLKEKLKSIPDELLNLNDKKARQRQMKANLKKLEGKEKSKYDISDLLAAIEIT